MVELNSILILINEQPFTKTSNCWGVQNQKTTPTQPRCFVSKVIVWKQRLDFTSDIAPLSVHQNIKPRARCRARVCNWPTDASGYFSP
jgi:hypothetical protein